MKVLNNYIVVERIFNKENEASGIIYNEKIPENKCLVIYSGNANVKKGDWVLFKHHDFQHMETINGKERKLWFIHPDNILAICQEGPSSSQA